MKPREILIYLALKYNGDHQEMMRAISEKENIGIGDNELPDFHSKALTFLDEDYPEILKQFYKPPLVLFYHGDISLLKEHEKNLAVIGTRSFSKYGEEATKKIVQEVDKELTIVSGLASGIDSIAHRQALLDGAKTIAVLGSGINYCYPADNQDLYDQIKKKGLIISEYPDMTPPSPDKFPFRNRLIAFISKTVLITEAHPRSGTSITAGIALDCGKDVCCVPYQIGENSLCNRLIANGAFLVESGSDVLNVTNNEEQHPIFEN